MAAGGWFDEADLIRFHRLAFDGSACRITFTPERERPMETQILTAVPVPLCDPKGLDLVDEDGVVRSRCVYQLVGGELTLAVGLGRQRPTGGRPQLLSTENLSVRLVLRRE